MVNALWTKEELQRLKEQAGFYASSSWDAIFCLFPGRSAIAIKHKAQVLGISREMQKGKATRFLFGHSVPDEIRSKISKANKGNSSWKGRYHTPASRQKMSLARKEAIRHNPKLRDVSSQNLKTLWQRPGFGEKRRELSKQRGKEGILPLLERAKTLWKDPDYVRKVMEARCRPEVMEKLREKRKLLWQNPDYVQAQMRARGVRPNKAELQLEALLKPLGFSYVGDGRRVIGRYCPDYISHDDKRVIELFGSYWHTLEDERKKVENYSKYGIACLIIWERELKETDKLLQKVQSFNAGRLVPELTEVARGAR